LADDIGVHRSSVRIWVEVWDRWRESEPATHPLFAERTIWSQVEPAESSSTARIMRRKWPARLGLGPVRDRHRAKPAGQATFTVMAVSYAETAAGMASWQATAALVISCLALLAALISAAISFASYRLSRKAYESGGHHLTLTAEAQYGGRIESYPNQPVVLTVQLSNAGRGAVTVDSLRLVFAPWSSRVYLALPQEALLEPKEIRQRLEGHDGLEWRFDVGLAVTAKQRSFPMRGDLPRPWLERRLRRRWGPRPLWVVAQLGDGGSVDARLSDWASKLVYLKTSAF
jgi:hypothetical protein